MQKSGYFFGYLCIFDDLKCCNLIATEDFAPYLRNKNFLPSIDYVQKHSK